MPSSTDGFYTSPTGVFIDGCNTITDRVQRGETLASLSDSYPDMAVELLDLCNGIEGTSNIQEIYSRFLALSNAWLECADDEVLSLLWDDCINGICIYHPSVERYVLKLSTDGVDTYSSDTVKYVATPSSLNNALLKAMPLLKTNGWISRTVLLLRGGMNNKMIEGLIDMNLLVTNPVNTDLVALSRGALLNPNFTGIWR